MKEIKKTSIMKKVGIGVGIVGVAAGLIFGVALHNANVEKKDVQRELEAKKILADELEQKVKNAEISAKEKEKQLEEAKASIVELTEADKAVIADYEAELAKLNAELAENIDVSENAFSDDELSLESSKTYVLDNNDVEKLGDYEIDFDGDSIDVAETLTLSGELASNDNKFDGETMYKLEKGDIKYLVSFSEDMSALDLDEDTLSFDFLGSEVSISDWTSNSVTFDSVAEQTLTVGQTVNGVTLVNVGDDSVLLKVDGNLKTLSEGYSKDLGSVDVEVVSIFNDDGKENDLVVLKISGDLDTKAVNGEEYDLDEDYKWVITSDSIGLVLDENFDKYDEALKEGDLFNLPSEFASIEFKLSQENMYDLEVEKDTLGYTLRSDFEDENEVYFKLSDNKFYDEDGVLIGTSVEFGNSKRDLIASDFVGTETVVDNEDDVYKYADGRVVSNYDLDGAVISYDLTIPEEPITATIIVK